MYILCKSFDANFTTVYFVVTPLKREGDETPALLKEQRHSDVTYIITKSAGVLFKLDDFVTDCSR